MGAVVQFACSAVVGRFSEKSPRICASLGKTAAVVAVLNEAVSGEAAKEEVFVAADRTTDGSAEAMLVVGILRGAYAGVMGDRIEVAVAEELEDGAVEAVRAALGDDADDSRGVAAELGAVVIGDDVELADRVGIGNLVAGVAEAGHVEAAIEIVGDLADESVGRAVNQNLDLLIAEIVDSVDLLDTRNELEETVDVAVDEREIIDLDVGDGLTEGGVAGIDQGDIGADVDGLVCAADLEGRSREAFCMTERATPLRCRVLKPGAETEIL